jgi:hypothetical protein
MGYSKTAELGDNFEYGGTIIPTIPISAIPTTFFVSTVGLPNEVVLSSVKRIYIDLRIRAITSNAGAGVTNSINGAYWIDCDDGVVLAHAMQMSNGQLTVTSAVNDQQPGTVLSGDRDVKAAFMDTGSTAVYLTNWACTGPILKLYDVQAIARVMMT